MEKKKKVMSDGEVNDMAFKRITGDLDSIEASGMFGEDKAPEESPNEGVKMEAGGYSIHVKPMAGEQVQDMPKIEEDDDADKRPVKLGVNYSLLEVIWQQLPRIIQRMRQTGHW